MASPSWRRPSPGSSHTDAAQKFCSTKLLEGVGRLTLAGVVDNVGVVVFSDFELKTKPEKKLIREDEIEGLLGPASAGGQ